MLLDLASNLLLLAGGFFFCAGTVGLLRFPDVYTRLHALAKADNLGLGCLLAGLALKADSPVQAIKLLAIWPLVLVASAVVGYAIAHRADRLGITPWQRDDR